MLGLALCGPTVSWMSLAKQICLQMALAFCNEAWQ